MSYKVASSRLVTGSHSSLEFDLLEQADPGALVQAIANLREPRTTTGGVNLVAGFRPSLWGRVAPKALPAEVTGFDQGVHGVDGDTMPATQHDLWLWVAGHAYDEVFDVTKEAVQALAPLVILALEVAGWTYKENREGTHDAAAFEALAIEEQQKVIGRTKESSIELAEEVRGAQSHMSRTVIEEHGAEQHIFRRNTPFGTATEHGTMFIG